MNCLLVFVVFIGAASAQNPPPTVDELDLDKYYGRWYNTHSNSIPVGTYLKDGVCGTATYKICDSETVGVYNSQNMIFPANGTEDFLTGRALLTEETGKLKLFLDGIPEGEYWVMKTGEVRTYEVVNEDYETEERDLYSYSLVSDSRRLSLFVIVRDVQEFRAEFEEEALNFLYENGFDNPISRPIELYHGDDCVYADPNPDFTC